MWEALISLAVVLTIAITWISLSLCAVAKACDEDEYTGTESPLTNAQVRQILMRERYERESI